MDLKLPTTYEEQLEKLISRGIVVEDEERCKKVLEDINYYRLTAYFLPFKLGDGNYIAGTSISTEPPGILILRPFPAGIITRSSCKILTGRSYTTEKRLL